MYPVLFPYQTFWQAGLVSSLVSYAFKEVLLPLRSRPTLTGWPGFHPSALSRPCLALLCPLPRLVSSVALLVLVFPFLCPRPCLSAGTHSMSLPRLLVPPCLHSHYVLARPVHDRVRA